MSQSLTLSQSLTIGKRKSSGHYRFVTGTRPASPYVSVTDPRSTTLSLPIRPIIGISSRPLTGAPYAPGPPASGPAGCGLPAPGAHARPWPKGRRAWGDSWRRLSLSGKIEKQKISIARVRGLPHTGPRHECQLLPHAHRLDCFGRDCFCVAHPHLEAAARKIKQGSCAAPAVLVVSSTK